VAAGNGKKPCFQSGAEHMRHVKRKCDRALLLSGRLCLLVESDVFKIVAVRNQEGWVDGCCLE
jgi:hypothetical protein